LIGSKTGRHEKLWCFFKKIDCFSFFKEVMMESVLDKLGNAEEKTMFTKRSRRALRRAMLYSHKTGHPGQVHASIRKRAQQLENQKQLSADAQKAGISVDELILRRAQMVAALVDPVNRKPVRIGAAPAKREEASSFSRW